MENCSSKRRAGRPKAPPQTGPLVLDGGRIRTKLEIELGEETGAELKEYARWVELSSSLATADAVFTTIDYALRELFRRDRLWRAAKGSPAHREKAPATVPPTATASAARTLPPPNGSGTNRG